MAKKILVVEDVDDSRSILVVMDLGLPGMSGIDATKVLKANPSTANIPIVAHTAWSAAQWGDMTRNVGMVEFLEKPVPIKIMKQTIENFLGPPCC